jgi:hypothetical protein
MELLDRAQVSIDGGDFGPVRRYAIISFEAAIFPMWFG